MKLLFDIETDGFLDQLTKVHCLVIKDLATGQVFSCADQAGYMPIEDGLSLLAEAVEVWGHNIIDFDLPALQKVYGLKIKQYAIHDTLVYSRLIYAHMMERDWKYRPGTMPTRLYGRHSLESWGHRLGYPKGENTDWSVWTPEMQEYCERDVDLNHRLIQHMKPNEYSETAIQLEHEFKHLIAWQERMGVPFDAEKARALRREVEPQMRELEKKLVNLVPARVEQTVFTPRRDNKTKGYIKGVPITRTKTTPFNPGSRPQIIRFLKDRYNWEPTEFTDKGNPKIDREVMGRLVEWEEVSLLMDYLDMSKLAGQLWNGKNAWLKLAKEGRIHGRVNTNGAVTGRCTHSHPNLGQVPTARSYKGRECRACFVAPPGHKMVGADASGLELRTLSHYLLPYDQGRYAQLVTEGDVHTANQTSGGLPTRDHAKTFIYAFIYGAGDAKLGAIVESTADEGRQKRLGEDLRRRFLATNPALGELTDEVRRTFRHRGYLIGLDGRRLYPRGEHQALNTLLQGAGAVIMKKAMCLKWQYILGEGLEAYPALNVHDEYQDIVLEIHAERVAEMAVAAIRNAGPALGFKVPLDGEAKIGNNWSETH